MNREVPGLCRKVFGKIVLKKCSERTCRKNVPKYRPNELTLSSNSEQFSTVRRLGLERINKIIDEQNNDVVGTAPWDPEEGAPAGTQESSFWAPEEALFWRPEETCLGSRGSPSGARKKLFWAPAEVPASGAQEREEPPFWRPEEGLFWGPASPIRKN